MRIGKHTANQQLQQQIVESWKVIVASWERLVKFAWLVNCRLLEIYDQVMAAEETFEPSLKGDGHCLYL